MSSLDEVVEHTSKEIAQTLHEMETVFVDGEKARSDAILIARVAQHVATESVAETEATMRETEQLVSRSLRDRLWCWMTPSQRRPHRSTCGRLA